MLEDEKPKPERCTSQLRYTDSSSKNKFSDMVNFRLKSLQCSSFISSLKEGESILTIEGASSSTINHNKGDVGAVIDAPFGAFNKEISRA